MAKYTNIQKEETLKSLVFDDYFDAGKFGYEPNIDNIDFVVTDAKTRGDLFADDSPGASIHHLWGEAKKGVHDVFDMFTQLLLTCKKTYDKGDHLAPPWLCCFDEARISFVPFHDILPLFNATDINWTQTPSNHETKDFEKAQAQVKNLIGAKIIVFNFGADDRDIKAFIKTHIGVAGATGIKSPITKENFVQIFIKWVKEVKPTINISREDWTKFKTHGVLDADFFRADMMSSEGNVITLADKLKIVLQNDKYKYMQVFEGDLFSRIIDFTDGGVAYQRFWNRWERPPVKDYQQYILDRRDLLVPENIREWKGSFFTPSVWVKKSQDYLAKVFGKNWQNEYYVWDCAAGTGNLLSGLTNPYNVWASDIDEGNVETIQSLIDIDDNLNLLSAHVFQFDFLNDSFDKLPEELKKIIDDPEKRKKLIVYINPPYAEVSSHGATDTKGRKSGVNQSKTHDKYSAYLGTAGREVFALFLARIYFEIPDCKIGEFSTLKSLNGSAFEKFRDFYRATLKKCFMVPANTFDNVAGQFPIGFKIWDTEHKKKFEKIAADVFDASNQCIGNKRFYAFTKTQFINNWIGKYKASGVPFLGYMDGINGNDFQHNNIVYITNSKKLLPNPRGTLIVPDNLFVCTVYFAVRHVFEHTWINHNDQFLNPNRDVIVFNDEFCNDCLVFTLFHGKNNISCEYTEEQCGKHYNINHWIPFTEKQVGAKEKFASNFMSDFIRECKKVNQYRGTNDILFSPEALVVLDAGLALWKYYHQKIKNLRTASVNASFYDIRAFFQGRDEGGKMNTKSGDETYNGLIKALRDALKTLAEKIQPKVYEYGFLKE